MPAKADVAACAEFYSPSSSRLLRVENKLARGRIISDTRAGEGFYGARFVTYEDGTQGVWKSHKFRASDGTYQDSNSEIAAYIIDRYLGPKRVPPTVIKEYKGKSGTVQLRIQDIKKLPKDTEYVDNPPELGLFDFLIANGDRNSGNILERPDGSIVAIDHGAAFHDRKSEALNAFKTNFENLVLDSEKQKQLERLVQTEKSPDRIENLKAPIKTFTREQSLKLTLVQVFFPSKNVIKKLHSTTYQDWKMLVGDYLTETQIHQIMNCQVARLKELDKVENILSSERIYLKVPVKRNLP